MRIPENEISMCHYKRHFCYKQWPIYLFLLCLMKHNPVTSPSSLTNCLAECSGLVPQAVRHVSTTVTLNLFFNIIVNAASRWIMLIKWFVYEIRQWRGDSTTLWNSFSLHSSLELTSSSTLPLSLCQTHPLCQRFAFLRNRLQGTHCFTIKIALCARKYLDDVVRRQRSNPTAFYCISSKTTSRSYRE